MKVARACEPASAGTCRGGGGGGCLSTCRGGGGGGRRVLEHLPLWPKCPFVKAIFFIYFFIFLFY